MELNIDTLQLFQDRDWVDYLSIFFQSFIAFGVIRWAVSLIKKKEEVEGEFTFETFKPYRVILGLRNTGKNRIDFDPKQGVYIQWENGKCYHKINLNDADKKNSSIQPQGSAQLRYNIELDNYEKSKIDSKAIKVFIYTERNNRFQLNPTVDYQLNRYWNRMPIEQYKNVVKRIKDIKYIQKKTNFIVRLMSKLKL